MPWVTDKLMVIAITESWTPEGVIIVDVRDLSDVETDTEKIKRKIIIIANLICAGHKVAVRCNAGMNRSCTVAITALCYMNPAVDLDELWNTYYDLVKEKIPRMLSMIELQDTCRKALKELCAWYN